MSTELLLRQAAQRVRRNARDVTPDDRDALLTRTAGLALADWLTSAARHAAPDPWAIRTARAILRDSREPA